MSNGEGIGVALFVQGCHFHCKNCFNPETWDFNGGKEWTLKTKEKFLDLIDRPYIKRISLLGGECLADENLDDILDLVTEVNKRYNITQDKVYVKDKNNNILTRFNHEIRLSLPQKSIWLYSGYTWEGIFDDLKPDILVNNHYILSNNTKERIVNNNKRASIISKCDVLIDGQYIDSQRDITLQWRGSKNQRVINVKESLKQNKIVLYCD